MSQPSPQLAALWEDLKGLVTSVIEEMNEAVDLRSKTGGLDVQFETTGKILISKRSLPRMYVTVDLRPTLIEVETRIVFKGAESAERQLRESLTLRVDEAGCRLRNRAGELLTVDEAVYYILRPFLHLGTVMN